MSIGLMGWATSVWQGTNTRATLTERGALRAVRVTPAFLKVAGMTNEQERANRLARQHAQCTVLPPPNPPQDEIDAAMLRVVKRLKAKEKKDHEEVSRLVSLVLEAYQSNDPREVLSRIVEIAPDGLPMVDLGKGA